MALKSAILEDFGHLPRLEAEPERIMPLQGPEYSIKASSSDRVYAVYLEPEYCECEGFRYKHDCIHVSKARLLRLTKHNEYFMSRYEREITARFRSFEHFFDWCWQGRGDPETVYLANLFLALLYCQRTRSGTTDLVHLAVNEQFSGDARKLGAVTRRLEGAGYIRRLGFSVKSGRERCHGAMKQVYKLTEAGESVVRWCV